MTDEVKVIEIKKSIFEENEKGLTCKVPCLSYPKIL